MRTRPFRELAAPIMADTERRAHVDRLRRELLAAQGLKDLRSTRRISQAQLAARLGTTQSGISRLEHQSDAYVSTLREYVEALGGKLEIACVFPEGRYLLNSFHELVDDDPADGSN